MPLIGYSRRWIATATMPDESEHSASENGTAGGTDYASSMEDSSLTQVSTGWYVSKLFYI